MENVNRLSSSFYVDNGVISITDENTLQDFIKDVTRIMMDQKFKLVGWERSTSGWSPWVKNQQAESLPLGLAWNVHGNTINKSRFK